MTCDPDLPEGDAAAVVAKWFPKLSHAAQMTLDPQSKDFVGTSYSAVLRAAEGFSSIRTAACAEAVKANKIISGWPASVDSEVDLIAGLPALSSLNTSSCDEVVLHRIYEYVAAIAEIVLIKTEMFKLIGRGLKLNDGTMVDGADAIIAVQGTTARGYVSLISDGLKQKADLAAEMTANWTSGNTANFLNEGAVTFVNDVGRQMAQAALLYLSLGRTARLDLLSSGCVTMFPDPADDLLHPAMDKIGKSN